MALVFTASVNLCELTALCRWPPVHGDTSAASHVARRASGHSGSAGMPSMRLGEMGVMRHLDAGRLESV